MFLASCPFDFTALWLFEYIFMKADVFFYDSAWFAAHCRDIKALLGEDSCVMRCRLSCESFCDHVCCVFLTLQSCWMKKQLQQMLWRYETAVKWQFGVCFGSFMSWCFCTKTDWRSAAWRCQMSDVSLQFVLRKSLKKSTFSSFFSSHVLLQTCAHCCHRWSEMSLQQCSKKR